MRESEGGKKYVREKVREKEREKEREIIRIHKYIYSYIRTTNSFLIVVLSVIIDCVVLLNVVALSKQNFF